MKKHLKSIVSLTAICATIALLLSLTNYITAPIIQSRESDAVNQALKMVLPTGEDFEAIDLTKYELPETITEAFSEKNGGYVFKITTAGYSTGFVIMCGIDENGTVSGTKVISSGETLGAENSYGKNLEGKTIEDIESVETVSGATRTTLAYKNAVKDSLNSVVILGGGSVDLRSEEEILNDNLNTALSQAQGKFTSVFKTVPLNNISKVFKADNNSGYVFLYNDEFIATDAQGNVLTDTDEEIKKSVSQDAKNLINDKLSEIDISKYSNMPTQIEKAYKTTSGNLCFELRAAGFGINGDDWYNPSGEYIKIKVSATRDGKIIACETTYQKESDGYGSACGDYKFYSQFDGKTKDNYSEIDAISGATTTTNGYKTAVSKVFEAIEILKGEF